MNNLYEAEIYENQIWMHYEKDKVEKIKFYLKENHLDNLEFDENIGYIIDIKGNIGKERYTMIEDFYEMYKDKIELM